MVSIEERRETGRRGFFLLAIYGLWSLIGSALALPAAVYLLLPPRARKGGVWIEAGDLATLRLNDPEELVFRRNRLDGWKMTSEKASAWVVKLSDKEAVAFTPQCTHLGCAYHWNDQKQEFLCPCHTSTFSAEGKVLSGPASRNLERYEVKVEGTKLLVKAG
jgi:menaquinol-cytochrome c reductase iron-sulfur subunit